MPKMLLYDDNCPLCAWYSNLFVNTGWLDADGRRPFSALDEQVLRSIDHNRARNEIPLWDSSSGKVWYGIDALLEVIGSRHPFIKAVGHCRPVNWLLKKFYKLVSYNRKVVVAKKCGPGDIDCTPDINYTYRIAFLLLALLFNSLMLLPLHSIVLSPLAGSSLTMTGVQTAHFSLVAFNCLPAFFLKKKKAIEYLGQVNMLALLTMLLLIPLTLASYLVTVPVWLVFSYMLLTAVIIFKEFLRRMDYAGMLSGSRWIPALNLAGMLGFTFYLFH